MYIWRVNRLIAEFKVGNVPERQQLYYLLVFMVLTYIATDPYVNSMLAYETHNSLDILMLPAGLIVGVVGTIFCYYGSRGVELQAGFIPRYICLGLPILVRIVALMFLVMFSAFVLNDYVVSVPGIDAYLAAEQTTIIDFIGILLIEALYFLYLSWAIKESYA